MANAAHVPRVAAREGVLAFEGEIPWGMWMWNAF
jgi:hypothetical protein